MIVVSAVMPIQIQEREAFIRAASACADGTRKEAGNISYTVCESVEEPGVFITVEEWEDSEAEEAHMQSGHLKTFIGTIRGYLAGAPNMKRYESTRIER